MDHRLKQLKDLLVSNETKKSLIQIIVYASLFFLINTSNNFIKTPFNIWIIVTKVLSALLIFLLGKEIINTISVVFSKIIKNKRSGIIADQILQTVEK